eukprot:scaffold64877_cov35-Phaeocystis_antarctica.AAC.1
MSGHSPRPSDRRQHLSSGVERRWREVFPRNGMMLYAVKLVRAAITPRLYLPRPGEGTLGKVSAARMAEKGTRALNPLATRRYGEAPSVRKGWVAPRT